jgi:hypothetical protein
MSEIFIHLVHDMLPHQETTFMTVWSKFLITATDKTQEWHSVGMYQAYKGDIATEFDTRQEADIQWATILTDNCHRSLPATTLSHSWAVNWVGHINMINKPTESWNWLFSGRIMTSQYSQFYTPPHPHSPLQESKCFWLLS